MVSSCNQFADGGEHGEAVAKQALQADTTRMSSQQRWYRALLLGATIALVAVVSLFALDVLGIGPNLGLPFGYYGRFNQVMSRIQAIPEVRILETSLHKDVELEDFHITVQTKDGREVRLSFAGANAKPLSDLLQELEKVGR